MSSRRRRLGEWFLPPSGMTLDYIKTKLTE
jgi:hypothetical protein